MVRRTIRELPGSTLYQITQAHRRIPTESLPLQGRWAAIGGSEGCSGTRSDFAQAPGESAPKTAPPLSHGFAVPAPLKGEPLLRGRAVGEDRKTSSVVTLGQLRLLSMNLITFRGIFDKLRQQFSFGGAIIRVCLGKPLRERSDTNAGTPRDHLDRTHRLPQLAAGRKKGRR